MNIAYTLATARGDTDLRLLKLATALLEQGYRPCGTVQINTERADAGPCDMDVRVLPDGPVIRISQDLGQASRGCRLDPGALETAVGHVAATLAKGADCLIVNKFGKHEAEGHGFREAIAEALSRDIPVLVGLNRLNAGAFMAFTENMAVEVEATDAALLAWMRARIGGARRAA